MKIIESIKRSSRNLQTIAHSFESIFNYHRRSLENQERMIAGLANLATLIDHRSREISAGLANLSQITNDRLSEIMVLAGSGLPAELQEHVARQRLRDNPTDIALTRSTVALLGLLGKPTVPVLSAISAAQGSFPDSDLPGLIREASAQAEKGDTLGALAYLWQAAIRHPASARGYAELALFFAQHQNWNESRAALKLAMGRTAADSATRLAVLSTLDELTTWKQDLPDGVATWIDTLPAAARGHPLTVAVATHMSRADFAAEATAVHTTDWGQDATAWLAATKITFASEAWEACYACVQKALEADFPLAVRSIVHGFSGPLARVLNTLNRADELAALVSTYASQYPESNLIPALPAKDTLPIWRQIRQTALDRGLPSAFLITLPKSASVSVANILNSGFGLPTVLYAFTHLRVIAPWLADYVRGGACYTTHLYPTSTNIDLLCAAGVKKVHVHVRDPRQQLVSFAEHRRLYPEQGSIRMRQELAHGTDRALEALSEEQMLWPIQFIDGWVKARERLQVDFSTFEEFVTDKSAFVDRVVGYYGGDRRYFDAKAALAQNEGTDYHRRKGSTDEWRTRLNAAQVDYVNRQIPNHFWTMFGWTP